MSKIFSTNLVFWLVTHFFSSHSVTHPDRQSESSDLCWEMLLSWYRGIKKHAVFAPDRENSSTFDNYTTHSNTCVASTTLQYHPGRTMKCTVITKLTETFFLLLKCTTSHKNEKLKKIFPLKHRKLNDAWRNHYTWQHQSIGWPIRPTYYSKNLFIHLSICLLIHISICLFLNLFIYLFIYKFIHLFIF